MSKEVAKLSNDELRELGRPYVTAWLDHRGIDMLRHGDAADLMVRVGAAVEAERHAQPPLDQVQPGREQEREIIEAAKVWRFCDDMPVERFDFPEDARLARAVDALNATPPSVPAKAEGQDRPRKIFDAGFSEAAPAPESEVSEEMVDLDSLQPVSLAEVAAGPNNEWNKNLKAPSLFEVWWKGVAENFHGSDAKIVASAAWYACAESLGVYDDQRS